MACHWMYQWLVIGCINGLPGAGVVLIVNWNSALAVEYLGAQWLVIGLPCAGVVLIVY